MLGCLRFISDVIIMEIVDSGLVRQRNVDSFNIMNE